MTRTSSLWAALLVTACAGCSAPGMGTDALGDALGDTLGDVVDDILDDILPTSGGDDETSSSPEATPAPNPTDVGFGAYLQVVAEGRGHVSVYAGFADQESRIGLDPVTMNLSAYNDDASTEVVRLPRPFVHDRPAYAGALPDTGGGSEQHVLLNIWGHNPMDSVVTLPPPFEMSVLGNGPMSRSRDDVQIAWSDPTGGSIHVHATGLCLAERFYEYTEDDGEFVIPAGALVGSGDGDPVCDVQISLIRTRQGHLSEDFSFGSIRAQVVRVTTFASLP